MLTVPLPAISEPGMPIPANVDHAVSVSLPMWQDNIDYEEGRPRISEKMVSGYPRFFYHKAIKELCRYLESHYGAPGEACLVLPSSQVAKQCQAFVTRFQPADTPASATTRVVTHLIPAHLQLPSTDIRNQPFHIYAVFYPDTTAMAGTVKLFWQHSGEIISSRLAAYCLRVIHGTASGSDGPVRSAVPPSSQAQGGSSPSSNSPSEPSVSKTPRQVAGDDAPIEDVSDYLEFRYGRNTDIQLANDCKLLLRRRIAAAVAHPHPDHHYLASTTDPANTSPHSPLLTAEQVYLFPTGMSAIYNAHRFLQHARNQMGPSACFGFPYTDTLKILQKFGDTNSPCHFFGLGEGPDYEALETTLREARQKQSGSPSPAPLLALFCECPSNPLLKTPDLPRLRALADEYGFAIVVDETIGNFININSMAYADVIVSSLTKVFSGDSNVMGGSMVINPQSRYFGPLTRAAETLYEDLYWCEDAVFMERNSRTFRERVQVINENAERLADMLNQHPLVTKIHYPKYTLRPFYDALKYPQGGYGGLLSIELVSEAITRRFYDAICCAKGPSLGTNFTLISPYTILAHYHELDWAESFGVSRFLIRCSIGMEHADHLLAAFHSALDAATVEEPST
ncbi:pyridoxal phosphate-dependent transferase [Dimargaris cristalligena]|uniref:Pyridoxal phosphate-dependent transferase n=1 Tax=Dimargaris cristalligena TaxID=215637 RepID=A0A4P9ZNN7_9FUNG|nr:pyridoxal phosphate-dependent transferase [Dimargaris cristalligena]|eukprot:RKP35034.1 pyridoxal phosphate-dependent transferase [Dimargaris cristalligena]